MASREMGFDKHPFDVHLNRDNDTFSDGSTPYTKISLDI